MAKLAPKPGQLVSKPAQLVPKAAQMVPKVAQVVPKSPNQGSLGPVPRPNESHISGHPALPGKWAYLAFEFF